MPYPTEKVRAVSGKISPEIIRNTESKIDGKKIKAQATTKPISACWLFRFLTSQLTARRKRNPDA